MTRLRVVRAACKVSQSPRWRAGLGVVVVSLRQCAGVRRNRLDARAVLCGLHEDFQPGKLKCCATRIFLLTRVSDPFMRVDAAANAVS